MVLDIRYLRAAADDDESAAATPAAQGAPEAEEMTAGPEAAAPAVAPAAGADLATLLDQAAGDDDPACRAEAVTQLRSLVPSPEGVEILADILGTADDPRRLVAAQVLGHHRQWLAQKSGLERLIQWARAERDPEVGAALVWALRNRDAAAEFLMHPIVGMAREAAMGVHVSEHTVDPIIHTLMVGRSPEIDRVLGAKLRATRSGLVPRVVALIQSWMGQAGSEEVAAVLAHLPQVPLFRIFIEGEGRPQWQQGQTAAEAERARTWHQLAAAVDAVLRAAPGPELVRHLVSHTARDEAFARRHAAFLEAAGKSRAVVSPELLQDLARLTATASNEKLGRLAELLVELSARLDGDSGRRAEALLEEWKARSPDLKLMIYHLQQGLR